MPEACVFLIAFMRRSVYEIIFNVFVRSMNTAHNRKINSLVLFIINCKELREIRWRGILLILDVYCKFINMIKKFMPNYGRIRPLEFENELNK